jgi:haloalkane dehalogenase
VADFAQLYPFASHFLDLDGHRYHYLDEGQGPVLLLLHGNPTWSFYYRELVLALRDRFRVIVPDHLGCGLSDKPQDYPYRLANHIANLQRLIAHLKLDRYTLICHDWGGPIGFGAAVTHPERIERLVVFNTTCLVTDHYPRRILVCQWPLLGPLAIRGLNFFARGATRMAVCHRDRMTPAVKAGYLRPYDSYANRIANLRFVQDIPLRPSHPSWATAKSVEERLPLLAGKPMLICWGQRDFCFDDYFLDHWRRAFPHAQVHVFPDAGHYVVEDAADRIIPLLRDFLAAPPQGAAGSGG